jgi:hypothetical protein
MKALFAVAAIWMTAASASAQHVLTLPGKTVEVVGLKRWTIAMIEDSMAKYAPGESLTSHACAAVLRYKLGFADASATTYMGFPPGDTIQRIVVALIEPQDSGRVRHRVMPMDTTKPYKPWAIAVGIVDSAPGVAMEAMRAYVRPSPERAQVPEWMRGDSTRFRRYQRFLASRRTTGDYRTALRILAQDPNYQNRVVAVSILANFVTRDSALYALIDALMESDGMAKDAAATLLEAFGNYAPRSVDWKPKAASLHAMLNGNVSTLPVLMSLLVQTGADSTLAKPLLANGGESVLAFVGAEHPGPRGTARRLLVALAGRDLGPEPTAWSAWIRGL